jgi:hypothetical protein
MARSKNAQLAVDLFDDLQKSFNWTPQSAWQGIARLLLSCEVWKPKWEAFHDVLVYIDSNRFIAGERGPSSTLRKAEHLTAYLASQLGVERSQLCSNIGLYFQRETIRPLQPHNLIGHAFRSLVTTALHRFGDPGVVYQEEVSPHAEFPGQVFTTRSKRAMIDIVARRDNRTVALMTVRWRIRHDRLDVIDEAMAYAPAAHRHNPHSKIYAVIGEFDGGRLRKVLANSQPIMPHAALAATVHFAPQLIREGLSENGTLEHLQSLEWLIGETFKWR